MFEQVDAWWLWQVGSIEIGAYETEAEALAAAEASAHPSWPVMIMPGKLVKKVEEE